MTFGSLLITSTVYPLVGLLTALYKSSTVAAISYCYPSIAHILYIFHNFAFNRINWKVFTEPKAQPKKF